ncbi:MULTISPECIES: squalene/phytoene synthase family protein [Carnobacterium]|uniref:Phytoene/squalene synthase family protein n=1 Tax=Carnobacterium inhibens TaxID=147709 RepID=A0ABR7TDP0_9LACT|nr:squalene/phytoene synthase family protein [Carnobacterium inhibens]MBC9825476.1 phytoene/squalene synthase family protein [Carnobacterium inhibens]
MNKEKYPKDAMRVLKETSRTFYIPITFLKADLKYSVASAYLVLRAIDEIEDHESIQNTTKFDLLMQLSELFKRPFTQEEYCDIIAPVKEQLPEVSIRLVDWIQACPEGSRSLMMETASEMAFGMAKWAKENWQVHTKEDLDDYTYYVAGCVGVYLSKLWNWSYGQETNEELAIEFGRGLQIVNILRNQKEDKEERGVSFVPDDWSRDQLFAYADENLAQADAYIETLNEKSTILFCRLPLAFAHKSLAAMKKGEKKMSRAEVEQTVKEVQKEVDEK